LQWERELLGVYLSQHPLESFRHLLSEQTVPLAELTAEHHNKAAIVGGMVTTFREITTKNGAKMAFVGITDEHNELEIVLFPNVYQQTVGIWDQDKVVIVRGKVSAQDKEGNTTSDIKVLADEAREVTHEQAAAYQATGRKPRKPKAGKVSKVPHKPSATTSSSRMYVRMNDTTDQALLLDLKTVIESNGGETEVVLVVGPNKQVIRLPSRISTAPEAVDQIINLVGADNVKLQ
jgi:DNA polymerase III alpha subunit